MRDGKTVEHKSGNDSNCRWCPFNGPQRSRKENLGTGYQEEESRPFRPQHCQN